MQWLTLFKHTGMLEVFNGLVNKYCPKREHFSFLGMMARHQLAILDNNKNVDRKQARTKSGEKKFKYQSSKVTKQWSAKPVPEKKDMSHLRQIINEVCEVRRSCKILPTPDLPQLPSNIAPTPMPSKEKLRNLRSRFAKKFTE